MILRESEEVEKEIEEVLFDLAQRRFNTWFGSNHSGSADNVRKITREDLEKYIKTHYTAPRMVVVGTGAIDHDELVKLTEAAFKDLPAREFPPRMPSRPTRTLHRQKCESETTI